MSSNKKRGILVYGIGLFVARAAFFGMNPLAIGYFTAAYIENAGGLVTLIAITIGASTIVPVEQVMKLFLTMFASIVINEIPFVKRHRVPQLIQYVIPPIIFGGFSVVEAITLGSTSEDLIFILLEVIIAFVSAVMFKSSIEFILGAGKGYKMNNEQMISMAIVVAVIIYAMPDIPLSYISPVETTVFFIILFMTYKYGVGQGAITGAVCGFVMSLRGVSVMDVGILTMMGIVPAIFRELGRVPTAIMFVITASITGVAYEGRTITTEEISALLSASILFLLFPKNLLYRVETVNSMQEQQLSVQNLKNIANTKMRIFSDSFIKLSKTLDTITERQKELKKQEINRIFEDVSEKLCKDCSNCDQCWDHNFQETYQAACNLFETAEKNGVINKEDIPLRFQDGCICVEEFIAETNRSFEIAKLNQIWHNRIAESREVIADQLKEVSFVMQDITSEIYNTAQASKDEEDKVYQSLKAKHIIAKDIIIFERADQRKEIFLYAAEKKGECVAAKEAAMVIGEALGMKVKVSDSSKTVITKEFEKFVFIEDTKYKVLTGVARAMKENVSGDNFSIIKMETGEMMLAVSDGMGTGEKAGEESETVMSLLEQMIESGLKAEKAIKLINSSLVLKSDQQTFSTIDMSIINLFTGMCEFIKLGAAAAFIKRGTKVETISLATLPIGMLGTVDYDTVTKKLYEGDIVIMVTDGVLDCIKEEDKESYMEQLILNLKSNNPQEIANRILDHTLAISNYVPMDDMTVMTAGIWRK